MADLHDIGLRFFAKRDVTAPPQITVDPRLPDPSKAQVASAAGCAQMHHRIGAQAIALDRFHHMTIAAISDGPFHRAIAEMTHPPPRGGRDRDLRGPAIHDDNARSRGPRMWHHSAAATLPAQQFRQLIGQIARQLRLRKLHDFPVVCAAVPDGQNVCPRQNRLWIDRLQRAADQLDGQRLAVP